MVCAFYEALVISTYLFFNNRVKTNYISHDSVRNSPITELLVLKQTTPQKRVSPAHSHDDVMLTAFYIKQWFIICKLHIIIKLLCCLNIHLHTSCHNLFHNRCI